MKSYLAYPEKEFRNYLIREELKRWSKSAGRKESSDALLKHYPSNIQQPNFFIRIALAVFTTILVSFCIGFLMLFFDHSFYSSNISMAVFSFFCSSAMIFALETYIRSRNGYRAGIDDVLLYLAYGGLVYFVALCFSFDEFTNVVLTLFVASGLAAFAAMRYNDMLMSATAYCAFVSAILTLLFKVEATAAVPFVTAILGGASYFAVRKLRNNAAFLLWDFCLWAIEILALLPLYLSPNYFVVRSLTEEMLHLHLEEGQDIPMAILFYGTTIIIPFVYLALGLRSRNRILFRTGLVLIAVSALTFKYYFSTGHHEITLTLSGGLILLVCTFIHFWLKEDKHNVSLKEDESDEPFQYIDAESLLLVQGLTQGGNVNTGSNDVNAGGGAFGGGGSSDSY